MKDKNGAWVAVNAIPLFYGYNSDKVQEADVPKSALDFLKPLFRGKIVTVYPTVDDATLYNFDLIVRKYGLDYMTKYMANQPYFINGSHRNVAARVSSGEDFVSFDMSAGPSGKLKTAMSANDETPVFFTAGGVLKKAPHPNAAKLFVTWMLSKEQQGRNPALYSPRRDLPPPAGMPPLTSPGSPTGTAIFSATAHGSRRSASASRPSPGRPRTRPPRSSRAVARIARSAIRGSCRNVLTADPGLREAQSGLQN